MTNKLLSQLSFLVAISLLILFGRNLLGRYQNQQPNEYQKAIKAFKVDDFVRVELNKGNQNTLLTKQDGKWKVASKAADTAKVNELIGALLPKQSPQLISENKDKFNELGFDQSIVTTVTLITQQKETVFMIGNQMDSNTAVILSDINKVFGLPSMPLISVMDEDWIDKTVVDIDSLQVKQLIFNGKDKLTLNQVADRQWTFDGSDQKVNSDGVNTFMYKFNPFKADNLASEEQKKLFDLSSNGFLITLIDKNDIKTDLFFKPIKDQYVVKHLPNDEYYLIDKNVGEGFDMKKSSYTAS